MESGLLLVVSVVAAGLVDIWLPRLELAVIVRWVVIVALIMGFLAILGQRVCGRFDGILILNRYRISLSRRQLTLYASIVWSALFAQETRLSHLALAPPRSPEPVITNNKKQTVSSRKPQLLQEQRLQAARPASSSAGRGRCTSDGLRVTG